MYKSGAPVVTNVSYNAADQMTSINHNGIAETRQYNALYQLTRITVAGQMDLEYRYSASANNGQITQMKNWISGEEVNYTYDAVGRLSAASTTGTEWGLSFTYDGFGNKTAQTVTKGTAPAMSVGVDGNNRVVGWTYDAAGFPTAVSGQYSSIGWDAQGRMQGISVQGGNVDTFVYDTGNRRVWRNNQLHLRGVDGKVVALLNFNTSTETFSLATTYAWFAGRKVGQKVDRLGTVQNGSRIYPYGEESASTGNDTEKFATYWRDSNSGLDYAVNRFYKANTGRFMSPDPYRGSATSDRSASFNRYAYVEGDPINSNDPSGLCPEDEECPPDWPSFRGLHNLPLPIPEDVQRSQRPMPFINPRLSETFDAARQALRNRPECANLFGDPDRPFLPTALELLDLLEWGTVLADDSSGDVVHGSSAIPRIQFGTLPPSPDGTGVAAQVNVIGSSIWDGDLMRWVYRLPIITIDIDYWQSASLESRAHTMIHEMGHVYGLMYDGVAYWNPVGGVLSTSATRILYDGYILADGADLDFVISMANSAQAWNNALIYEACFKEK